MACENGKQEVTLSLSGRYGIVLQKRPDCPAGIADDMIHRARIPGDAAELDEILA